MPPANSSARPAFPLRPIFGGALRAALGTSSEYFVEIEHALTWVRPPPRVCHAESIPRRGPFIVIYNHYDRPGLRAWWGPFLASWAIARQREEEPRDLRIVITSEWSYPIVGVVTRWLFTKLSQAYGFILLPPVDPAHRLQSALAIRRLAAMTAGANPPLICISPEGKSNPDLALRTPPPGAGLFLKMLCHDLLPFLPVGFSENEQGALLARFGDPFHLPAVADGRAERDRALARAAMVEIGTLLPERMWGAYRDDIRETLQSRAQPPGAPHATAAQHAIRPTETLCTQLS